MSEPVLTQSQYSDERHETWQFLYERQRDNLSGKASDIFLDGLNSMESLTSATIPRVDAMAAQLDATTGWGLTIVPGLISVEEFFALLARRKFCTSVWVRRADQVDYIEEPDMFHDTFGHIPPLMNLAFADFMQRFGEIGLALSQSVQEDAEQRVLELQRLYWYFVEFGFVRAPGSDGAVADRGGDALIIGAGLMSSFGETNHAWSLRHSLRPFDLAEIMATPFITTEVQSTYFLINSIPEVIRDMDDWFDGLTL